MGWIFPLVMLVMASVACGWFKEEGTLGVGNEPITFTLFSETQHTWDAVVIPGNHYQVILRTEGTSLTLDPMSFHLIIRDQRPTADETPENIASDPIYDDHTLAVDFTAPSDGTIVIELYTLYGESQANQGTFTLQLLHVD